MNGILIVNKERGFTSHDVVAKLRGITKQKKIGHTGTLDPDARGALPICLGNATKLCDLLTDKDKVYEAVLRFGITTDTQDSTGTVLKQCESTVTEAALRDAVLKFTGDLMQIPPMYSAIKIGGKKLYELARQGREVERPARPITIYRIDILSCSYGEDGYIEEAKLSVSCSKGTYIRTLCSDIGEMLGCGGCMSSLLRTRAGAFSIEDSLSLAQIQQLADEGSLEERLIPVDSMFRDYPKRIVRTGHEKQLYAGNPVGMEWLAEKAMDKMQVVSGMYDPNEKFLGIYEYTEESGGLPSDKTIFIEYGQKWREHEIY